MAFCGGPGGRRRNVAAMSSTAGARFLSESGNWLATQGECGMPEPEPEIKAATAPLYEIAAVHDGQPPEAWLKHLMRIWGDLD